MNYSKSILSRGVDNDMHNYDLSSLYAWIQFIEGILNISYKIEFKSWIGNGDNKYTFPRRKRTVFRNPLKVGLDYWSTVVKQGCGITNDRNTIKRFFTDVKTTVSITDVNENLIQKNLNNFEGKFISFHFFQNLTRWLLLSDIKYREIKGNFRGC